MELSLLKIKVLILCGTLTLISGLLPLILVKIFKLNTENNGSVKKIISLILFFAGGAHLGGCFSHIMPQVREYFKKVDKYHETVAMLLPEIACLTGFFFLYMLEGIIHEFIRKREMTSYKLRGTMNRQEKDQQRSQTTTDSTYTDQQRETSRENCSSNYTYMVLTTFRDIPCIMNNMSPTNNLRINEPNATKRQISYSNDNGIAEQSNDIDITNNEKSRRRPAENEHAWGNNNISYYSENKESHLPAKIRNLLIAFALFMGYLKEFQLDLKQIKVVYCLYR